MSLFAVIGYTVGPIGLWLIGIFGQLINTYGQTIGGVLGIPIWYLYALILPFGL
jgi:hypothetical protein